MREHRMSEGTMREVVVRALIDDAYDGLIRLLDDARRFGFGLQELKLVTDANGVAAAVITLCAPNRVDAAFLAPRLARHPTALDPRARPNGDGTGLAQA